MRTFILNEKVNTSLKLAKLDFQGATIHKQPGDVNVGFTVKFDLNTLKSMVKDSERITFKRECTTFLAKLCSHMDEKNPLKYTLYRNAGVSSPIHLAEDSSDISENRLRRLLELVVPGKHVSSQCGENSWNCLYQANMFQASVVRTLGIVCTR